MRNRNQLVLQVIVSSLLLLLVSLPVQSQEAAIEARANEAPSQAAASSEELVKHELEIVGTSGKPQSLRWIEPLDGKANPDQPRPLLVFLHSWSADFRQIRPELEVLVAREGWWMIVPDFQGPNLRPEACGSAQAQADILDAVLWACQNLNVDRTRIYLTGVSGGGHMTMLMVGRYPKIWAAASAWVGISDLACWHREHAGRTSYATHLESVCGGAWRSRPEVDEQYMLRSPMAYLHHAHDVPLDIAAGGRDGYRGSVPIHHSIDAFRRVVVGLDRQKPDPVDRTLQQSLEVVPEQLPEPSGHDDVWERDLFLRVESGVTRLTIFDGGHEGIDAAVVDFLKRQAKQEPIELEWLNVEGLEPDFSWWHEDESDLSGDGR